VDIIEGGPTPVTGKIDLLLLAGELESFSRVDRNRDEFEFFSGVSKAGR